MADWLMRTIREEARRLLQLAGDDELLRVDLRALAEEILAATETSTPGASSPRIHPAPEIPHPTEESSEPLHELTLGQTRPSVPSDASPSTRAGRPDATGADLTSLQSSCRRKAEAARRVAESQRAIRDEAVIEIGTYPTDDELAGWAEKLTSAFYWSSTRSESDSTEISMLDEIAGCFDTLAEGLSLVQETQGRRKAHEQAIKYLAEAQSAARRGLQKLGIADDPDQESVYEWIRSTAAKQRIYLDRYMRADDLADPTGWPTLLAHIEEARSSGHRTPLQTSGLERIGHLAASIREHKQGEQAWPALIETVARLVEEGMPPSTRELREALMPIIDDVPDLDNPPPSFQRVLREVDRYLASRPFPVDSLVHHEPAAEVKEVARLLSGRSIVLIGGIRRREAQETLKRSFGLDSLIWIETKEHQSVETFEPVIVRPEIALVLLAIRWSSHGFGEVRHFCERHGKPLVRLPGGYSPNQVAAQILAQVSEQLRASQV